MIKWTWFKENGIETKRDFLVALRMALPIEIAWFFFGKIIRGICTEQHLKSMARSNIRVAVIGHIHWSPPHFSSKFSFFSQCLAFIPCSLFNCSWPFDECFQRKLCQKMYFMLFIVDSDLFGVSEWIATNIVFDGI